MRKSILILSFLSIYATAYSQVLKGTVKDKITGEIINYASIYFNGTFAGTNSDKSGNFELDISRYPTMPVTISALGYYSISIPDLDPSIKMVIYLTPKLFELNEVVINAKKISRERRLNMGYFRREFLGTTMNSANCVILNEDDIYFSHDPTNDTLKATSINPIIIENKALGYKLTYYLDIFLYSKSTNYMLITGSCIFNEDINIDKDLQEKFERRRSTAYLGSRMHFIRSLWWNNLAEAGFVVRDSNNKILTTDNYVSQNEDPETGTVNKYFYNQKTMFISYFTRKNSSHIILDKDLVYFDSEGYFDPLGITWQGEMSRQRIGDLLPFEY